MTLPSRFLPSCRALALGAAVVGLLTGCLDGPFAHANPFDPDNPMTLSIEGGVDTISVAGEVVQFHLVSDPLYDSPSPYWSSSTASLLVPLGYGRFVVPTLPIETTQVLVHAALGNNGTSRSITILGAAP